MDPPVQFFEFWYFAIPNYLMAALMYSLLARFLLSLVLRPDSPNYIFRFLVRVTDPVLVVFGWVTPRAVPGVLLMLFSVVWLLVARFVFFLGMAGAGLAPTATG